LGFIAEHKLSNLSGAFGAALAATHFPGGLFSKVPISWYISFYGHVLTPHVCTPGAVLNNFSIRFWLSTGTVQGAVWSVLFG